MTTKLEWPGVRWTHRIKDGTIANMSSGAGRSKVNNVRVVIIEPDEGDALFLPMSVGMGINTKGRDGGVYIASAYLLKPHAGFSGSTIKDVLVAYNKVVDGLSILKYNNEIKSKEFFRPYASLEEIASML